MYAKVCVDVITRTDDLFLYRIPDKFHDCLYVGSRVYVEFGFQKTLAYVIEIIEIIEYSGAVKDIIDVIDFEYGLSAEQIGIAYAISNDTKSPLSQCLRLMYPGFMQSKLKRYAVVLNQALLPDELIVLFQNRKKILISGEVLAYYKKIREEEAKGNIEIITDIYTYGKRKVIKEYRIIKEEPIKSVKQQAVIAYLKARYQASAEEIKDNTGVSDRIINRLAEQGLLEMIPTFPLSEPTKVKSLSITFDFDENQIRDKFRRLEGKPFLFYTDNEDFRLRFCLDGINATIETGRKVLILTPTLLAASSLDNYFRNKLSAVRVCTFSSLIAKSDFYYNYQNVVSGNVDLIITTIVGIFLPLDDIGLIIMIDEDHHNYINEQNPKFSALEVLKYRAHYHQAKLLLTTTVPSVVSYYHYTQADYYLLELLKKEKRNFELVNVRAEPADMLLSSVLRQKLDRVLADGKISMLVLNSLGYSTANICDNCGHLIKCPQCKIGLVYYKNNKTYRCRYCNQQFVGIKCENCESVSIKHMGYGLERLAERLSYYYPKSRIYRVSSLSMQKAEDYDEFLLSLEEGTIDIVIGTNILLDMISPEIALLAIINADAVLYTDDYRSAEMCYRLLSKTLDCHKAKAVIQGYNLDHYAITSALNQDFLSFYNAEILARGYALYPPYAEMNKLTIIGEYKDMYYYANYFKKVFNRFKKGYCLGPVYIPKTRGVQLAIKHNDFSLVSSLIDEVNKKFMDSKLWVNFERYPRFYD